MLAGGSGPGGFNAVPGSNPAGTGQALNFIGNHAYAYSGVVTDPQSGAANTTALKFTTGNLYINSKLTITSDEIGAQQQFVAIKLDGQVILEHASDSSSTANPFYDQPFRIIIPAFSDFEVLVGAGDIIDFTAILTGRVYS
jgi:hypothetical protein